MGRSSHQAALLPLRRTGFNQGAPQALPLTDEVWAKKKRRAGGGVGPASAGAPATKLYADEAYPHTLPKISLRSISKRGAQASSAWALKPQLLCSAHALLGTPPSTWVPLLPTHRPLHTNEPRPGLPDSKLVPCLLVWPVRRRLIRRRARDAIVVLLRVAIVSTSRTSANG